jgi:hypothetical protein
MPTMDGRPRATQTHHASAASRMAMRSSIMSEVYPHVKGETPVGT